MEWSGGERRQIHSLRLIQPFKINLYRPAKMVDEISLLEFKSNYIIKWRALARLPVFVPKFSKGLLKKPRSRITIALSA